MRVHSHRPRSSEHLLTRQGRARLRDRAGVADLLEEHRWLTTGIAAFIVGAGNAVGALLLGLSPQDSLLVGAAAAGAVFGFFTVLSLLLRRPVIPELLRGENEPGEVDEDVSFERAWEAAQEARIRNLREGDTGAYWIEVQLPSGGWSVELRGRRRRRQGSSDDDAGRTLGTPDFGDVGGFP